VLVIILQKQEQLKVRKVYSCHLWFLISFSSQQIQDRFWNFIFYKFIFIFGVLNVQKFNEVMWWTAWFTLLGFFHLFTQLCKDRFEYVSISHIIWSPLQWKDFNIKCAASLTIWMVWLARPVVRYTCICCGLILSLVQYLFSFVFLCMVMRQNEY